MIIHSIVNWYIIIRKIISQYFPKLYSRFGGNVKVKLDLSNYAAKSHLKKAGVDTWFCEKSCLKSNVDKSVVDKEKAVPIYLKKLSDVADNDVVKKHCIIS